ncbi:hypothetical protein [Verrucomicrobium sp. 3C]|uniref:hypothetical protein n=1 Tax=Verrucomicrobium sp. 3C TaxID=1134055 RepID=UPI00035EDFE2|nr:hypothetical protein [Verrucomicrobium sp. 3C]
MNPHDPSKAPKEQESDSSEKQRKPFEKNFYWVITLAGLYFLYLIYSVLNHDTVNIHGH